MDEQQETSLATTGQARLVHRLAVTFYTVAATAAVIGQTWVAVEHLPWPDTLAPVWRVAAVIPFAAVLELLAVVLAVMADYRLRLGERAVGVRVMSAAVAVVATGVIVIGHGADHLYLAVGFGALSAAAYLLSLAHMSMRRRDALRAAGLLAQVPPAYGVWRWVRRPVLTARAAELARVQGLGLRESLRAAELELRAERRRPAIAAAVESAIRSSHDDPRMAEIAVSTLDLDRIAEELAATADYAGWAKRLAPAVTAPEPEIDPETGPEVATTSDRNSTRNTGNSSATSTRNRGTTSGRNRSGHLRKRAARLAPREQGKSKADRIRTLMLQHPEMTQEQLAKAAGASDRYVRMVLGSSGTTSGQDTGNGSAASGQISGPVSGAVSAPVPAQMNGHHPEL